MYLRQSSESLVISSVLIARRYLKEVKRRTARCTSPLHNRVLLCSFRFYYEQVQVVGVVLGVPRGGTQNAADQRKDVAEPSQPQGQQPRQQQQQQQAEEASRSSKRPVAPSGHNTEDDEGCARKALQENFCFFINISWDGWMPWWPRSCQTLSTQ